MCELDPGKKQILRHLIQSSALCPSSYLKQISRIIIISFFCGAKVIALCLIWCEDLQTCHHKSWNATTRRTGAVLWGLRTVLVGEAQKNNHGFWEEWKLKPWWSGIFCEVLPYASWVKRAHDFIVHCIQNSHNCYWMQKAEVMTKRAQFMYWEVILSH